MAIHQSSLDTNLKDLLDKIAKLEIQLPDFQRGWTWDNDRIIAILASLSQGYPMGAIMQLENGNTDVQFKCRIFEGVATKGNIPAPQYMILDGQQRLTSIYWATYSQEPVKTYKITDKNKIIEYYYYIDINKALDSDIDRIDAIVAVPKDRKIKTNFDRDLVIDLSTAELEYKYEMFPINKLFNQNDREDWADEYKDYYDNSPKIKDKYKRFRSEILDVMVNYKLPVITMGKDTPREAVCKVFENVNTGGVSLTVFELVTAMFATYSFNLREDWEKHCKDVIVGKTELGLLTDALTGIDATDFLQAVTLYTTYVSEGATSCKKKDILSLKYDEYIANRDKVLEGFALAREFLLEQYIFKAVDLPYTSQIIPLSVIFAVLKQYDLASKIKTKKILSQWFWCGILGELYGGANETRYVNDVEDVINAARGKESENRTIKTAFFSATRLLSLITRISAAYKGVMALMYKAGCRDFLEGMIMNTKLAMDKNPDIHHIFPAAYCKKSKIDETYGNKWNCIVNKTPLLPPTNRFIGGRAPSVYCRALLGKLQEVNISEDELQKRIESNQIDYNLLKKDNFGEYFIDRAKRLLILIEEAMGKDVADRDSQQTIEQYGVSLRK